MSIAIEIFIFLKNWRHVVILVTVSSRWPTQTFYEDGGEDFSKTVIQIHFEFSGFICHNNMHTYNVAGIWQYYQPLLPSKIL